MDLVISPEMKVFDFSSFKSKLDHQVTQKHLLSNKFTIEFMFCSPVTLLWNGHVHLCGMTPTHSKNVTENVNCMTRWLFVKVFPG